MDDGDDRLVEHLSRREGCQRKLRGVQWKTPGLNPRKPSDASIPRFAWRQSQRPVLRGGEILGGPVLYQVFQPPIFSGGTETLRLFNGPERVGRSLRNEHPGQCFRAFVRVPQPRRPSQRSVRISTGPGELESAQQLLTFVAWWDDINPVLGSSNPVRLRHEVSHGLAQHTVPGCRDAALPGRLQLGRRKPLLLEQQQLAVRADGIQQTSWTISSQAMKLSRGCQCL